MSDAETHTPFQAPAIEEIATLFPAYDVDILIATGGMGAVYRAVQRSLDRTVAIKILPEIFSTDASFCASFEAEAKAMARLNHPNLVGVYDFGEVNGMLFIVMEYVPGQSLFHSSHGNAIDPGEVIRLVTGIASGLAHAHENGILHRDIKPSNILLDLNAEPKIGDFGLARPADHKIEEGEEIFGTPHYTAPEVVHSPHSVDARADIFSLGVLLHELLTGRLPADDPRPPSAISLCDHRFDAIVRRATDPNPAHRYSNAAEIATDLQKIAATPGPRLLTAAAGAGAPKPAYRPRPVKVNTSSGAPTLIILLLIAAALGVYYFMVFRNRGIAPAETPGEQTTPPAVEQIIAPPASQNPALQSPAPTPPRDNGSQAAPAP
ncbi:MAG: protein kinase domain-containing protein [Verrucomicrobiales bacterium]|nr:protein kinase [Verrucomicrobiota bacterium JB025]